jgi:hypothetical protein
MTTDTKLRITPGPWKVGQSEAPHEVYGSNSMIARCYGHSGDNKEFWETAQANAKIIAEAPNFAAGVEMMSFAVRNFTTFAATGNMNTLTSFFSPPTPFTLA